MAKNPYEELGNAVVLQAVKDYRDSKRTLKKHPKNTVALKMKSECERFLLYLLFALVCKDGHLSVGIIPKTRLFQTTQWSNHHFAN